MGGVTALLRPAAGPAPGPGRSPPAGLAGSRGFPRSLAQPQLSQHVVDLPGEFARQVGAGVLVCHRGHVDQQPGVSPAQLHLGGIEQADQQIPENLVDGKRAQPPRIFAGVLGRPLVPLPAPPGPAVPTTATSHVVRWLAGKTTLITPMLRRLAESRTGGCRPPDSPRALRRAGSADGGHAGTVPAPRCASVAQPGDGQAGPLWAEALVLPAHGHPAIGGSGLPSGYACQEAADP